MADTVSKSRFKARALEYFRQVEQTGRPLVLTDRGRPVLKIVPYEQDAAALLEGFAGLVRRYDDPLEPVGVEDWDSLA
jgi:prevent-host-death family protein